MNAPTTTDNERTSLMQSVRYISRALLLIWRAGPWWSVANLILIIIRGTVPLLMLWVIKLLVDTMTRQLTSHALNMTDAIFVLALMGTMFVINAVAGSLHALVKERQSFKLMGYITSVVHEKTAKIDYHNFEDANFHSIYFRAVNESLSRPMMIFYNMVGVFQNGLTLCVMAAVLMSVHWLMPITILLIGIPIVIMRIKFSRRYYRLLRNQTDDERRMYYYNSLLTMKEYAKELRIFDLSSLFMQRYRATLERLHRGREKILVGNVVLELVVQALAALAMVAVFAFVIWLAIEGHMSVGELAMYFMAMYRSYNIAQDLLQNIASLYESNLYLKNLFEFIDMPIVGSLAGEPFPRPMTQGISLRNVSFKYPNTTRIVLNNVSLDIKKNETIAVVGNNGSGKSTLIKLLCGLYRPDSGTIEIDGVPLRRISQKEISENVSAIFQDFTLYNASARDNVWFGNINAARDDKAIRQAAENAGIAQVFDGLKKGFDTQLGNLFADGEMLSRGEWQRTALARSFFNDAQIIVLDEPTSALDAFTEAGLVDKFRAITSGRTAIIVSHRLATVRIADRIVVMADKRIVEVGTYDELMAKRGHFYDMVKLLEM